MIWIFKYKEDFKKNLTLALPIIFGQIGQVTVNIVDNVMVGRINPKELAAESLAAISLSNSLFISLLVIGYGVSFALPPLVAEAVVQNNHQAISKHVKHSFVINMIFACISILLISLLIPSMQYWGQEDGVVKLAIPYLRISSYSMILVMLFQTFRTYSEGKSQTIPPMIAILIGNVLNIGLNYIFIYGKMGFPELGVYGAAIGTLLSRIVMVILLVILLKYWDNLWEDLKNITWNHFERKEFNHILKLGVPTSMQGFFEVSAFGAAAIMAGQINKETQAAHQIAINLASISFLICSGLAMAATIRVGNQKGLKDRVKLRDAGFSAIIQVVLFMAVSSIILLVFRGIFPMLYTNNEHVIRIASGLLILASIFQIPDGVQVASSGALRGIQDVTIPSLITLLAYWVIALPLSYFLCFYSPLGAQGIWIGLTIGLTISAIFLTLRFQRLSFISKL